MARVVLISFLLSIFGCREIEDVLRISNKGLPDAQDLSAFDARGQELEERLMNEFRHHGYVVAREGNAIREEGDSLLWTGLSLGTLPCVKAKEIFETLYATAERYSGSLVRIDPLPESYKDDPTSRDMEVGAMFGILLYLKKCEKNKPIKLIQQHFEAIRRHNGRLYSQGDNSKININPSFRYFMNIIAMKTLKTPRPPVVDASTFESGLLSNAVFVQTSKDSCYPIHLSTLQLILLAHLGEPISASSKSSFCETTRPMKLPLTDWFCERLDIETFLREYKIDALSYQHQRCPDWESLDNRYNTPALDWIVLKRLADGSIPGE